MFFNGLASKSKTPGRLAVTLVWLALIAFMVNAATVDAARVDAAAVDSGSEKDPLTLLGFRASEGAAANYVVDRACGTCHAEKYQSYQHVGMAKSFARPAEAKVIEDFGREFFHAPSQRYYRIDRNGEKLEFHRYQRDADGKPLNEFKTEIDWIMGSGNRARSYLYQTEWGELYMLPLGWYSETKAWGMSPGFENKEHPGVMRRAQRQCMFCHNGFAEVPSGSDSHWQTQTFPKELPQGTGCQRCHGPGAEHIRAALTGATADTIRGHIVNPRKLPPEQRDSVCFQCHMLPTVSMIGARRFERGDYSFRPGERLSDYMVHVDIDEVGVTRTDRFEINHHGYRLWQSRCFQASKGELGCISCHDPHVKPTSREFRAKVAGVCSGCHQDQTTSHKPELTGSGDCVTCHMPTRRTRDVVLVTMTDHHIARGPFNPEDLVKPIPEREPIITGLELLPFGEPPRGEEAEIYRIAAVLRSRAQENAASALKGALIRTKYPGVTPYLDLLEAQLKLRDYSQAEETANFVLLRQPDLYPALGWLGVAQFGLGQNEKAMASLNKSLALKPTPDVHFNLALVAFKQGQNDLALEQMDAAIAMRPNFYLAWLQKGRIHASLGALIAARDAMLRALEIEPANTGTYQELVRVLRRLGDSKQADRYLDLGLRVAWNPVDLESLKIAKPEPATQVTPSQPAKDGQPMRQKPPHP